MQWLRVPHGSDGYYYRYRAEPVKGGTCRQWARVRIPTLDWEVEVPSSKVGVRAEGRAFLEAQAAPVILGQSELSKEAEGTNIGEIQSAPWGSRSFEAQRNE